jgi:hypothetical protein
MYQIIFGSALDMTFVRFGTAAALGLALAAYFLVGSSRTGSIRPVERIYWTMARCRFSNYRWMRNACSGRRRVVCHF